MIASDMYLLKDRILIILAGILFTTILLFTACIYTTPRSYLMGAQPTIMKESEDYFNAPPLTQEQKDTALEIASTSSVFSQYKDYPMGPWNYQWNYPYDGHSVYISAIVNPHSESAKVYGLLSFTVDINNSSVTVAGFLDWHQYW